MRKIVRGVLPLLIFLFLLSGCGSQAKSTTVSVSKKGAVTQTIVEKWDPDQYDKDDLKSQIKEDIASYDGAIKLKSIKVKDKKIYVKMTYSDVASYADYNGVVFFQGTVSECQAAGYLLQGEFQNTKGEEVSRTDILMNADTYKVLAFEEPMTVKFSGKMIACSSSLKIKNKKEVKASKKKGSDSNLLEEPVYIVYR